MTPQRTFPTRNRHAFTLVEVIIWLFMLAALTALGVSWNHNKSLERQREQQIQGR